MSLCQTGTCPSNRKSLVQIPVEGVLGLFFFFFFFKQALVSVYIVLSNRFIYRSFDSTCHQFSSIQLLSHVQHCNPWTTACQSIQSIINPWVHANQCPLRWWCHPTISSFASPFPTALNLSQHQGPFQWVSSSHQVAKVSEFQLQHQSFQWTPRTDLL